jgi:outer membrane protein, heavy metal efflux system
VRRFEQDGGTALVAGISLPLFSATRAGPAIAAGEAERARVDTERANTLLRTRALLFAQHQEMEHARHVVSTLREHILVPLGKALDQTESAYRRGRYAYLEWSEAQSQLLDARLRLVDAAADFHIRRIEIERLTGASLTSVNDNTGASP